MEAARYDRVHNEIDFPRRIARHSRICWRRDICSPPPSDLPRALFLTDNSPLSSPWRVLRQLVTRNAARCDANFPG